jgi:uncharacterized membrane protein
MTQPPLRDREQILESIRERNEQIISAGRQTRIELLEAFEQTLSAFADSQEKLADSSEVEWLSRLLRAQATFTRDVTDASGKFARQLLEA